MTSTLDLNPYDANHGYGPDDFDDEEPVECDTCQRCGGSGTYSDCFDDLCNGGECIHGDDSTCRECQGIGEVPLPASAPSAKETKP